MEKLRSECEARGEHLPEVPSFQMEIRAGCRFLMESQFLLGAGSGKIGKYFALLLEAIVRP